MTARILVRCMFALALPLALGVAGCDCNAAVGGGTGTTCRSGAMCPSGICRDGRCVAGVPDGGRSDAGPPEPGCVDADGDRYGVGCSRGPDCDDTNPVQTGTETCDGQDNDCDGVVDNGVLNACGTCDPTCVGSGIGAGTGTGFDTLGDPADGVSVDPTDGAIILDSTAIDTNIIWLANTTEGSVSKVDTNTFTELARYITGPAGGGNDPSRTSVNGEGDVYVGNRGGGSVSKISVLGAMCPDTTGDGAVTTSAGATDVRAWGTDDCVLWNTPLPGSYIRAVAAQDVVGPDGEIRPYVWVGDWTGARIYKLDGRTGMPVLSFAVESGHRTYGFAFDAAGNLWFATLGSAIGRVDTNRCVDDASCAGAWCTGEGPGSDDCVKQIITSPQLNYGITVDFNQRVWTGGNQIQRYDPTAAPGSRWRTVPAVSFVHGIAADGAGWVWGAGYSEGVVRVNADDPTMFRIVAGTPGVDNKGMAVDQAGKVWSVTYSGHGGGGGDATVITPGATIDAATIMTGVAPEGNQARYTYSDMTGLQLRLATNPHGYYQHVFEGCDPATATGTEWGDLRWDGDVPPGTTLRFRVRTAATVAELAMATWVTVADVPPDASPASVAAKLVAAGVMSSRYLEVRVELTSMRMSTREVVTPRVRSFNVTRLCPPIFG